MNFAIDTNILLRVLDKHNKQNIVIRQALRQLKQLGLEGCFFPQNAAEFWNVSTRPATARGGLGLSLPQTLRQLKLFEKLFVMIPDSTKVYRLWRGLIVNHHVIGLQVYDARMVASMQASGVKHLLTYNSNDFQRFNKIITSWTPDEIVQGFGKTRLP